MEIFTKLLFITAMIVLSSAFFLRHAHNTFVDEAHLVHVAHGRVDKELERRHTVVTRSRDAILKEAYPGLMGKDPYLYFMEIVQNAGHRVTNERLRYNEAAYEFNMRLHIFPYKYIAWFLRREREPFFKADEEAESAPPVQSLLKQKTSTRQCSDCQVNMLVKRKEDRS
jgi:hypothetical protein